MRELKNHSYRGMQLLRFLMTLLLVFVMTIGIFPGRTAAAELNFTAEASAVSNTGYIVTVNLPQNTGIRRVLVPTWTVKNGQDDLIWHEAAISGSTATVEVRTQDHKAESGLYMSHVYVYSTTGDCSIQGLSVSVPDQNGTIYTAPTVDASVSDVTAEGYVVIAKFTSSYPVAQVLMPTWTGKNGQDDLVWHKASVFGNTAIFRVKTTDHHAESGLYYTHVYVYDSTGAYGIGGTQATVPASEKHTAPSVETTVSDVTADGYTVTATIESSDGISKVYMPTWTEANGQDDLAWYEIPVSGNTASFTLNSQDHKGESGTYITHIYVYDNSNAQGFAEVRVTVPEPAEPEAPYEEPTVKAEVTDVNEEGYTVRAEITSTANLVRIAMPTWTANDDQDDLIWHAPAYENHVATYTVKIADHNNEAGTYITHIYAYDSKGNYGFAELKVEVPAAVSEDPEITDVTVTDIDETGYTVTVTFEAPAGISSVQLPTWTEANGQDDLVWHDAAIDGNQAVCRIETASHGNNGGKYITHVYVTDVKNRRAAIVATSVEVPAPSKPVSNGHVICIDAGHQQAGISELEPNGPGSSEMKAKLTTGTRGVYTGLAEHELNLQVALKLKEELVTRGYTVVMIRETSDCTMSNAERAVYANSCGAEVFLRIHANGSDNNAISGTLAIVPSSANSYLTSAVVSASQTLSTAIVNGFCAATGFPNLGLQTSDTMTGINWCKIPVCILEMGFMSNYNDDTQMANDSFQYTMSKGIADGIDAYFGR